MNIFLAITLASGWSVLASPALAQPPAADPAPAKQAAKPKVYDETADAKQQIAAALATAKREHRRVLIQWGGNWCPWCIKLDELFRTDRDIKRELLYEYDLVHADCGRPAGKNVDLAKGYDAAVDKDGFPYLTILDASGRLIVNQASGPFEVKSTDLAQGHDPKTVLKFLQDHRASVPDAGTVLDSGMTQAKAEGKAVFLHFGAPWCPWCRRLDAWMAKPDVAAILAKDFVDVKIDTDRMTGGKDAHKRFAGDKAGGIPWFVFLGPDAKPIADSNAPGPHGNIGFPSDPAEIAHFESMLKKAKKNLTDADIAALIDLLKKDKPTETATH
jgi:thiol-disulfide isomerase/thioredoxin